MVDAGFSNFMEDRYYYTCSLGMRRTRLSLQYCVKLISNEVNHTYSAVFQSNIIDTYEVNEIPCRMPLTPHVTHILLVPMTPACTWWNMSTNDNSLQVVELSGLQTCKLLSTHPSKPFPRRFSGPESVCSG